MVKRVILTAINFKGIEQVKKEAKKYQIYVYVKSIILKELIVIE